MMMITRDDLAAAIEDGIISEAQASDLIARVENRGSLTAVDDERFRFLNGFNDIFLALGILLIAGAFVVFRTLSSGTDTVVITGTAIAVMWLLGELIIKRHRAVLPAIVINIVFALFAYSLFQEVFSAEGISRGPVAIWRSSSMPSAFLLLAFTVIFYWRFRLPFTLGVVGALTYGCGILVMTRLFGEASLDSWFLIFSLVVGLAIFAIAVSYDFSDPRRLTRRSDCAFWLHLVSAPLISHGLMAVFLKQTVVGPVLVMLLGFSLLACVSLALDRRAPVVSALAYLGVTIAFLFFGPMQLKVRPELARPSCCWVSS